MKTSEFGKTRKSSPREANVEPVSNDDLIEGQKIAEALAETFPHEMNSHKGLLFLQCKMEVAALVRDMRLKQESK